MDGWIEKLGTFVSKGLCAHLGFLSAPHLWKHRKALQCQQPAEALCLETVRQTQGRRFTSLGDISPSCTKTGLLWHVQLSRRKPAPVKSHGPSLQENFLNKTLDAKLWGDCSVRDARGESSARPTP